MCVCVSLVLGLTLAFAVPAMATELEVTYSSPGGSYSSNGYYNSLFGTAVDISYTITGNESPVTSVQVMVSNQEDEWTSLGSSTSGHYTFTPAYFTEFVPYFLVTFENHAMTQTTTCCLGQRSSSTTTSVAIPSHRRLDRVTRTIRTRPILAPRECAIMASVTCTTWRCSLTSPVRCFLATAIQTMTARGEGGSLPRR